jgi:hypothetical protein
MHRRRATDISYQFTTSPNVEAFKANNKGQKVRLSLWLFLFIVVIVGATIVIIDVLLPSSFPERQTQPLQTNLQHSEAPGPVQLLGVAIKVASITPPNLLSPKETEAPVNYHLVFSTACSPQQSWESYVLFYHAFKVNQPGNLTRIASGCTPSQAKALTSFHETVIRNMSNHFHLHFTPDYSKVRVNHDDKKPYKYMNKPFGLRHWFENKLGLMEGTPIRSDLENDIVILLDPDMILLKPLGHDFSNANVVWASIPKSEDLMRVRHGNPMAQQDGYLRSNWLQFNFTYITGDAKSPAYKINNGVAIEHYNTGPPYLATVKDMWNIATRWTEMAPRVHDVYPKLFAEMFGFCSATAHMEMPHTMIKSIVVSSTVSNDREGWALVDALPINQTCEPSETANLPFILHYCKRYFIGKWFFSKYRLRKNFVSCGVDLLQMPPSNITSLRHHYSPPASRGKPMGKKETLSPQQAKREVFMLCHMIAKINEAVEYYKNHHCDPITANFSRTYNFFDYPDKI